MVVEIGTNRLPMFIHCNQYRCTSKIQRKEYIFCQGVFISHQLSENLYVNLIHAIRQKLFLLLGGNEHQPIRLFQRIYLYRNQPKPLSQDGIEIEISACIQRLSPVITLKLL